MASGTLSRVTKTFKWGDSLRGAITVFGRRDCRFCGEARSRQTGGVDSPSKETRLAPNLSIGST